MDVFKTCGEANAHTMENSSRGGPINLPAESVFCVYSPPNPAMTLTKGEHTKIIYAPDENHLH